MKRRMKHFQVSIDDGMVVDAEGTVWVARPGQEVKVWGYIGVSGAGFDWDAREELPEQYEPYLALDKAAQAAIRKGMHA